MSLELQNYYDERVRLIKEQKDLLNKAEQSADGWTSERWAEFDRMENEIQSIDRKIQALEREESVANNTARDNTGNRTNSEIFYNEIFPKLLERGISANNLSAEERGVYEKYAQTRAPLGTGGVLVPDELQQNVIARMQVMEGARAVARVINTDNGRNFDYPFMDETGAAGEQISENPSSKTAEDTPSLTEKTIRSFLYSSREMVLSRQVLQDSPIDLVSLLEEAAAIRLFNVLNPKFTTGSGSGEPEGFTTAANSTVTTNAAGTLDRVDILDLVYSVARPYRTNGAFQISDAILSEVRKLELGSGDSRPLYLPSAREGEPDRLEGYPVTVNPNLDGALTAGNTIMSFGDFSRFLIRDVAGAEMLEFQEVRGRQYQTSYVMFSRHDSKALDVYAIGNLDVS